MLVLRDRLRNEKQTNTSTKYLNIQLVSAYMTKHIKIFSKVSKNTEIAANTLKNKHDKIKGYYLKGI
jgi:hypothetical protein